MGTAAQRTAHVLALLAIGALATSAWASPCDQYVDGADGPYWSVRRFGAAGTGTRAWAGAGAGVSQGSSVGRCTTEVLSSQQVPGGQRRARVACGVRVVLPLKT